MLTVESGVFPATSSKKGMMYTRHISQIKTKRLVNSMKANSFYKFGHVIYHNYINLNTHIQINKVTYSKIINDTISMGDAFNKEVAVTHCRPHFEFTEVRKE